MAPARRTAPRQVMPGSRLAGIAGSGKASWTKSLPLVSTQCSECVTWPLSSWSSRDRVTSSRRSPTRRSAALRASIRSVAARRSVPVIPSPTIARSVQDDLAGDRPVGRPDKLLGADRVKWVASLRAGEARAVEGIERLGRRAVVKAERAEGAERVEIDRDGHRGASAVRAPLAPDDGRGRVYCAVAARSRAAPGGASAPAGCFSIARSSGRERRDYFVVQAVGLQGSIVPFFRPANAVFSAVVSSAGGVTLRIGRRAAWPGSRRR